LTRVKLPVATGGTGRVRLSLIRFASLFFL
jgi:hypothetical protein